MQEVDSHKRSLYRKRFAMMDEVDGEIAKALETYLI